MALERAYAVAEQLSGATVLLVTTSDDLPLGANQFPGMPSVTVLTRAALWIILRTRAQAYRRSNARATDDMERRAQGAMLVRTIMMNGMAAALANFTGVTAVKTRSYQSPSKQVRQQAQASVKPGPEAVARQALTALETLTEAWEGAFAPIPTRSAAQEIVTDVPEFEAMADRASHLIQILCAASNEPEQVDGEDLLGARAHVVRTEFAKHCDALRARFEALNPSQWRTFDAVRDSSAVEASVASMAASARAALRARQLAHELEARAPHRPLRG
jgi:hypothetical protein